MLLPRPCQQSHTSVVPSPRITLLLHACLLQVHTQCEFTALMIIKQSNYTVKRWLNLKKSTTHIMKKKEDNKVQNIFLTLRLSIGHLDSLAGKDALP